mgnify:CR=1 FL=1
MQLQDLEIYQQLYEIGSINEVAKVLCFSQSNISARLQKIESELGSELFKRSYQGIIPTKNGKVFYKYAINVLTETEKLKQAMATPSKKKEVIISELLFDFSIVQGNKFDLTKYNIHIKTSTEITAIKDNTADLIITYANFTDKAYYESPVKSLSAQFLTATQKYLHLPFLINSDKNCPFRARTLKFINYDMLKIQEIDSWNGILNLVKNQQGIALLPTYFIERDNLDIAFSSDYFKIPYKIYRKNR